MRKKYNLFVYDKIAFFSYKCALFYEKKFNYIKFLKKKVQLANLFRLDYAEQHPLYVNGNGFLVLSTKHLVLVLYERCDSQKVWILNRFTLKVCVGTKRHTLRVTIAPQM